MVVDHTFAITSYLRQSRLHSLHLTERLSISVQILQPNKMGTQKPTDDEKVFQAYADVLH